MFRFLLYIFLITLWWPLYAATLTGKVVKIADGDTITVLDASNTQHRIRVPTKNLIRSRWMPALELSNPKNASFLNKTSRSKLCVTQTNLFVLGPRRQ